MFNDFFPVLQGWDLNTIYEFMVTPEKIHIKKIKKAMKAVILILSQF